MYHLIDLLLDTYNNETHINIMEKQVVKFLVTKVTTTSFLKYLRYDNKTFLHLWNQKDVVLALFKYIPVFVCISEKIP